MRHWHFGRYPATRSATARERLTEFVPVLIEALAKTDNPDMAFLAFDRFLARVPAGIQLFALLQSNKRLLLDLLSMILRYAPRLAETIIHRAHVLDALIEPAFFGRLPEAALAAAAGRDAWPKRSYEDVLNRARIFGQEQSFLIGVRVLAGTVGLRQAPASPTATSPTLWSSALARRRPRPSSSAAHGKVEGGAVALIALGRAWRPRDDRRLRPRSHPALRFRRDRGGIGR